MSPVCLCVAETDAAARQQQPVPGYAVRGGQDGAHAERLQQRALAAVAAPQHDPQRLIFNPPTPTHHPKHTPPPSPHRPRPLSSRLALAPCAKPTRWLLTAVHVSHTHKTKPPATQTRTPMQDWTRGEIRKGGGLAAGFFFFSSQLKPPAAAAAVAATRGGGDSSCQRGDV